MTKPMSEIPRPKGSLLSHSLRFARNTMQYYEDSHRECGDIFATRIPGLGQWVYIASPDLEKAMAAAPEGVLGAGEVVGFSLAAVLGKGATSQLDGAAHTERRGIAEPYFDARASTSRVEEVRQITESRIAEWPVGTPFPLVPPLQKIALESLMRTFFAAAGPGVARELADLYEDFSFKGLRSPTVSHTSLQFDFPGSPWRKVQKRQQATLERFAREIAARLHAANAAGAAKDAAADDLLLGMDRARLADGSRIPQETIRAEVLDLLFQGHELTGDSLTWTLGELLTHPEPLARLRQELDAVVRKEGIRNEHLPRLPYLEAVVYEGLRRRPVNIATTVRKVLQPFELGGYLLPEGTLVAVSYPALSMREDLFANPKAFDPNHFFGKPLPPEEVWSPFGIGPHACLGKHLAVVVIKAALATIVQKAELKLAQDEIRPVRVAYFYEPNKGLLATVERWL